MCAEIRDHYEQSFCWGRLRLIQIWCLGFCLGFWTHIIDWILVEVLNMSDEFNTLSPEIQLWFDCLPYPLGVSSCKYGSWEKKNSSRVGWSSAKTHKGCLWLSVYHHLSGFLRRCIEDTSCMKCIFWFTRLLWDAVRSLLLQVCYMRPMETFTWCWALPEQASRCAFFYSRSKSRIEWWEIRGSWMTLLQGKPVVFFAITGVKDQLLCKHISIYFHQHAEICQQVWAIQSRALHRVSAPVLVEFDKLT